jgi:PAS domain S-box-containing protein
MTELGNPETQELRQQLREQAERLRLALHAANLGTWEHVPSTHATFWDARSKAVFGFGEGEELTFDDYVNAIHPDDREQVFAGISKAMDPRGSGECSLQYRIRPRGGQAWLWVEAHGHCTFDGEVAVRINGTLLDITERKLAEEAVREAAQRKDEFLALLGHELRNPLAPIQTALDVMQLRFPDLAVREREVIARQLKHMLRLVDDLLDLARVARGSVQLKREVLNLGETVQRAIEIASPMFEAKRHRLDVSVPSDLAIFADTIRFSQVITNLLTNAAKFTPPGGRISVRARAEAGEVELEVADNGAGIAADQLERIFQPFVQAGREQAGAYGGLGLGLALVKDLVTLHGGSVEAHSAGLGLGSRFLIRVPLSTQPRSAEPAPVRESSRPRPGLRVLVVDDNEDATEMISELLKLRGYDVRVAGDGMQALAVARGFAPQVAVLDLGLPLIDGYELAASLQASASGPIRLIAVTGYGQIEDRKRTQAAGFARHLVKPVDLDELEAALSEGP